MKDSLKKIKDLRNDFSHEEQRNEDPTLIVDLMKQIFISLEEAGQLYGKDRAEIDAARKVLEKQHKEIINNTSQYYEAYINSVADCIQNECKVKIIKSTIENDVVHLPNMKGEAIPRKDVYYDVKMTDNKESSEKAAKTPFQSSDLQAKVKHKVVYVEAQSGSGKTIFLKTLLRNSVDEGNCLPLYIDCKKRQGKSLEEYMKLSFPELLCKFHDKHVRDALLSLKELAMFIDAYDEANGTSRLLVEDAVDICQTKGSNCYVTGRIHATNDFSTKFDFAFDSFRIEPLDEKGQSEMVKNYKKFTSKEDELAKAFGMLQPSTKKIFQTPLLMGSFISLVEDESFDLSKVTSESRLYAEIVRVYRKQIADRLIKQNVTNHSRLADKMMGELSKFCLDLYRQEIYDIDKASFDVLLDKCEAVCGNLNFEDIFSSILKPKYDSKKEVERYEFSHLSIQEHLASSVVVKALPKGGTSGLSAEDAMKLAGVEHVTDWNR